MQKQPVYYDDLNVVDDEFFTLSRILDWKRDLLESYKAVLVELETKIDNDFPLDFFINHSLLDEVVVDAVIGLKKVSCVSNNSIEEPNEFKIVAYLTYWWLRHKPVSTHFPKGYRLENVILKDEEKMTDEEKVKARDKTTWQLKHINEFIAVEYATTSIFNFDRRVYSEKMFQKIKKANDGKMIFESIDDVKSQMLDKFLYHLSYRAIAPKVIEHILEAYTIPPAWELTGAHWKTE